MVGPLAAPIIGALGSLLGGVFGKTKTKNEYVVPDYAKMRAKAEAAGLNPLFAIANAPGQVMQSTSGGYMGAAIADAAMIAADAVARRSDAGKLSDVQAQNRALNQKVQSLTLRPKIGGIYAQRGVTPNLKQALGVRDAPSSLATSNAPISGASGGDIPIPDALLNRGSGSYIAGEFVPGTDGWSPAQVWENEYGEVGAAFYGLAKMARDGWGYYSNLKPGAAQYPKRPTKERGLSSGPGKVIGGFSGDNRYWPNGVTIGRIIPNPKTKRANAPFMAISP